MRKFLAKHAAATTGTLSCFDRLLFKGHLPLGYPHAMEVFLTLRGVLFKDLKAFVLKQADRLKAHAQAMAEGAGRPYEYFESPVRKDQRARATAARDGITEGLVCVFATIEPCRSFRLAYGHGRPTIRPAWRKCLFLYFCAGWTLEPASLLASACTIAHGCGAGEGAARAVRDHLLGPRAADAGEDGVETRKEVRKAITRATPPMCWFSGRPRAGDARPLLSAVPGLHGAHSTPGRFGTSLGTRKRARLATGGDGLGN